MLRGLWLKFRYLIECSMPTLQSSEASLNARWFTALERFYGDGD